MNEFDKTIQRRKGDNGTNTLIRRIRAERDICSALVKALLVEDYAVTVNDGEEETVIKSSDHDTIFNALFTTDEDWLIVYKDNVRVGWFRLIYGNSGWDVINDYTVNLEHVYKLIDKVIVKQEKKLP